MKIIDELLDRIGIDKIYNYIEQSMLFYVSPTRYYLNLYSRERQEQYLQILLLLGMLSLCVLLFSEQIQLKEITRVVVIDLIITIFSFLPLAIAVRVVKKICHQPFDLSNVFVFVITSKYQLVPMLVIPLILYRKLENYSFYFIGVLIFWFMLFFIFIFSGRVFFSRIRYMALNFILAFIFFNVSLILIDLINIDSRPVYTGS